MHATLPPTEATSVVAQYDALVAAGSIEGDPAQHALARRLDRLRQDLAQPEQKRGLLARLLGRKPAPVTGLYIHGPVGRGKSMMMDLFVATRPEGVRRVHFHEFMGEIHARVHRIRRQKDYVGDPIEPVAVAVADASRVLCFDEFAVTDIGDAMILGRLFTRLFELGVVMVATSNVAPDALYEGGLNRGHFLPFIALLKRRTEIVSLEARTDYRLEKLGAAPVYVTPLGPEADAVLDAAWARLGGPDPGPLDLDIGARRLRVPAAGDGAARFSFAEICETALGAADYLALAENFSTVLIDNIPVIPPERRDIAKRFITLIDTFYDRRMKLVVSAAAEPEDLYKGRIGAESREFARTVSRLNEMRSDAYHAAADTAPARRSEPA